MTEELQEVTIGGTEMPAVVEDRHVRRESLHGIRNVAVVFLQDEPGEAAPVILTLGIQSSGHHALQAVRAATFALDDDIEEQAVGIGKGLERFACVLAEIVEIRRVEAEFLEARHQGTGENAAVLTFWRNLPPFGVKVRQAVVEACREVYGNLDVNLVAGIHLGAQEIEFQSRVHLADRGRMVAPAMMADGKASEGIDMRLAERVLPFLLLETLAKTVDFRRCMKIQVDLAES